MKITKLTALMLAAALVIALFAACGQKQPPDETDQLSGGSTSDEISGSATSAPTTDPQGETDGETSAPATEPTDTKSQETEPPVTEPPITGNPDTEPPETDDETEGPGNETIEPPTVKTLTYVALGDSICAGYGLADPENERYSSLIDKSIDLLQLYECDAHNYGVNGQTSSELLAALEADTIHELHGADIVTVSIGANNVLGPSVTALTSYAMNLLIEDETMRNAANAAAYNAFVEATEAGIAQFESDIKAILAKINEYAPDAQVVVQTVYNPYENVDMSLDFFAGTINMKDTADELVRRLNEIITANSRPLGYSAADVYDAFAGNVGYVNADGFDSVDLTKLDPHPTAEGHRVIAETISAFIYTE